MVFTPPGAVIKVWGKKQPFPWVFESVVFIVHALSIAFMLCLCLLYIVQHWIKLKTMREFTKIQYTTYILLSKDYLYFYLFLLSLLTFICLSVFSLLSGIQTTWNCGWRFFSVPMRDTWMWTLKSSLQGNFWLWSLETQWNAHQTYFIYAVL